MLRASTWPGLVIALGLIALIGSVLWALAATGGLEFGGIESRVWGLVRVSALQAALSTLVSLAIGIALAWALSHQTRFAGRSLLVALLSSSVVLPSLAVVLGLVTVLGRNGWLNGLIEALGGAGTGSMIYGLGGIIIAHAYLNGSFATRVLLERLEAIPTEKRKLVQSLGVKGFSRFQIVEWPAIKNSLPGLGATIFLLCFTSFAIVLTLGGSPRYNTLEVAIYEAVRLDFDMGRAVTLAIVQLALCGVLVLIASQVRAGFGQIGKRSFQSVWPDPPAARFLQVIIILAGTLGFILPLIAICIDGATADFARLFSETAVQRGLATSLTLATLSGLLTTAAALLMAASRRNATIRTSNRSLAVLINASASLYLAVPSLVLGLGFFLLARALPGSLHFWSIVALVTANSLMALPFAMILTAPALEKAALRYDRLAFSLGMNGLSRFLLIEWPILRPDIAVAFTLSFCLSFGDLSVIALFGTQDFVTLPWVLYQKMGSYRTNDAEGLGLILLVIVISAFVLFPRLIGGRRIAHT